MVFALADHFAGEQRSRDISPEHILRGLACASCGIGRTVLNGLGVDLLRLLPAVMQLLPPYPIRPLPPIEE
ncbi:MAG TPA: Clp protease N-terminal domain-containing protein, partial [Humisphaera sp.]|nr:Clp protease N-terminal domain-containing protein [Humisphaera sp.]